jgi:hypothetical protein
MLRSLERTKLSELVPVVTLLRMEDFEGCVQQAL